MERSGPRIFLTCFFKTIKIWGGLSDLSGIIKDIPRNKKHLGFSNLGSPLGVVHVIHPNSHLYGEIIKENAKNAKFRTFFQIIWKISKVKKIKWSYLIGNPTRIPKIVLKFLSDVNFMTFWRHNDVKFRHFRNFSNKMRLLGWIRPNISNQNSKNHSLSCSKFYENFKNGIKNFVKRHLDVIMTS